MSESVVRREDPNRFELDIDGTPSGFAEFVDHEGQRIMFHTEVPSDHAGKGYGQRIVRAALEATREDGLRVVPACPFVKWYIRHNPEFSDMSDPVTPAALAVIARDA